MVSHNLKMVFDEQSTEQYKYAKSFFTNDSFHPCVGYDDETLTIYFEDECGEPDLLEIQIECELCSTMLIDYEFIIC